VVGNGGDGISGNRNNQAGAMVYYAAGAETAICSTTTVICNAITARCNETTAMYGATTAWTVTWHGTWVPGWIDPWNVNSLCDGLQVYMGVMLMSAGMAAKVANNRKGSGNGISRNNNREGSWDMQERD